MEKYSTLSTNINIGDVIVFKDGTSKKVTGVSGHRVTFDDGRTRDLFVSENIIEGIEPCFEKQEKSIVAEPINKPHSANIDWDFLFERSNDSEEKPRVNPMTTYQELFQMMECADTSELKFSRYFWHYTPVRNLLKIVEFGRFKSRWNLKDTIPFDNFKELPTTESVIGHNRSNLTIRHVRFYLNPKNAAIFHFIKNVNKNVLKYYCAIALNKNVLVKSNNSTFLYYQNGCLASDSIYRTQYELNLHDNQPFYVHNKQYFNFAETYSDYDANQSNERRLYQMAEFMVWRDVPIYFIDKIYFYTIEGKNAFLSHIKGTKEYNYFKDKCIVDYRYFFYRYDQ